MNNKPTVICSCPCAVKAGYGYRSRDFLHSLFELKRDEWNIRIISQRWGDCPYGLLDKNNSKDKEILDNIRTPQEALSSQPDGFIMISVPNEMPPQRIGKYFNWVITAGVETTVFPAELLVGCNNADLVIFSSNFSKEVAESTTYDQIDNNTNSKIADLKLNTKSEVLFEGVDTNVFKKIENKESFDLTSIKESFCFLSVSHWLQGTPQLEDRKNLGITIKTFLQTFKDIDNPPALILKTSSGGYSIGSQRYILDEIDKMRKQVSYNKSLPNIYLIYGSLTDTELNALYNHSKVKVLIQCGNEGFGRPALEFSAASYKPIIASPHSGHVDFLDKDNNLFVGGDLTPVGRSVENKFLIKDSLLFTVNPAELSMCMKDITINYKNYSEKGNNQGKISRSKFSHSDMTNRLKEIIDQHVPVIPKQVQIKLPQLKKIELPTLTKINN